jgi:hypothetical protein
VADAYVALVDAHSMDGPLPAATCPATVCNRRWATAVLRSIAVAGAAGHLLLSRSARAVGVLGRPQ